MSPRRGDGGYDDRAPRPRPSADGEGRGRRLRTDELDGARGGRMARGRGRGRTDRERDREAVRSRQAGRRARRPLGAGETLATSKSAFITRSRLIQACAVIVTILFVGRLGWVQLVAGPDLAERASQQRTVQVLDPARRGDIEDRNGRSIAFTMEARTLAVHPKMMVKDMEERHRLYPDDFAAPKERIRQIAQDLPGLLDVPDLDKHSDTARGRRVVEDTQSEIEGAAAGPEGISSREILRKLTSNESSYEVLVRNVDPDKAAEVVKKFPEIVAERQDMRHYPNGAVGANVIGKIGMDGVGQFGFELSQDRMLEGVDGGRTVDISAQGQAIPGSTRNETVPTNGTSYELTLDMDMQYYVQQAVQQAKDKSGAKNAAAVVLDAHTGSVLAMAQDNTANPNRDMGEEVAAGRDIGNSSVSNPFEPGSVAKIITASAVIEDGLSTPDEVHSVPGSIEMAGVTVNDAWQHGVEQLTTAGIFGKSSNVGTLMLAQKVGEERFAEMLQLFGLGRDTGIELPGESPGLVPNLEAWTPGSFANLPIGQGMAMTLLQMTGIYQTIANDGVRIPPRIIAESIGPDGTVDAAKPPEGVRVISPEAARTVRHMFEGVVQRDSSGMNQGTAPDGALEGYRLSGKTGTAQKVDPNTGAYSNSMYYITFAGIAPADDPRFVIGVVLDEPVRGVHGQGGQSAAPLFRDIAAWSLNHYNVPPSPPSDEVIPLRVG